MKTYARILYGRVIDMKEAESISILATIYGPDSYWIEVTGIDCKVGYIMKYVNGMGVVPVPLNDGIINADLITIDEVRNYKISKLKEEFAKRRDEIRWVEVDPSLDNEGKIVTKESVNPIITADQGKSYGFYCNKEDMALFISLMNLLKLGEEETILYKVYRNNMTKELVELNYEQMKRAYQQIRYEQLTLFNRLQKLIRLVLATDNKDDIMNITFDSNLDNLEKLEEAVLSKAVHINIDARNRRRG